MSAIKGKRRVDLLTPDVGRYRIWQAIRSYPRFTVAEIAAISEAQTENIRPYVRALTRAGYLRAAKLKGRGGKYQYELVRDIGPLAPRISHSLEVLNPNLRQETR